MKTKLFKVGKKLMRLFPSLCAVFLFLFAAVSCGKAYYTAADKTANREMYDRCVQKAVATMGYLNGVQFSALHTGGSSYILYCGISALKDHWIQEDDRVLRTDVCDSMKVYFADIKPYFLEECCLKLNENQMTALMVLCARLGVGNFAGRMRSLQFEPETGDRIPAIEPDAIVQEFFIAKPAYNTEFRQYLWVVAQLFSGKLTALRLYDYPVMSYRYLDETKLYKKNGKPRYKPELLDLYRHVRGRSVREEGIIPYSQQKFI